MYKKTTFLYLSALFLVLLACSKTETPTFTLEGQVLGPAPEKVILFQESDIERKISTPIDTLKIDKEGKFIGTYTLEPHLYRLYFNKDHEVLLALDKGDELKLEVSNLEGENAIKKIQGSEQSAKLLAYESFRERSLDSLVKSVREKIKALKETDDYKQEELDSLGDLEVSNYEVHLQELNVYLKENMPNSLGLYASSIRWKGEENLALYDSLVSGFELQYGAYDIAQKLREKLNRLKQTSIGGKAANIIMDDPAGNAIDLKAVNKKYTLIDFWASWCGPCRRESESLNTLYTKYKEQGFEIYGVSLDDKRDKWLNALEKDKRNWPNVSTLERFATPAAYDYAVTALPDNYLIDADMKILAKNIHGEELELFLENLFKENN